MTHSEQTLLYYRDHLDSFVEGTITADMRVTQEKFLKMVSRQGKILDFGCGAGRDTKVFLECGYAVDAFDGSAELCAKATEYTGIPIQQMLFQDFHAIGEYDGVWACASILHLPKDELKVVIENIKVALKAGGVLYTSFKYGTFEGFRQERYFTDFTEETIRDFWKRFPGFPIVELWKTQDVRPGRKEEQWINLLAKRV